MNIQNEFLYFPNTPSFLLQVPPNSSIDEISGFLITLDSLSALYKSFFDLDDLYLTVILSKDPSAPVCYRKNRIILLNTELKFWSQAAYQFSHELCHFIIPEDVSNNLRWLEESICESASYYFLRKLTDFWIKKQIPYRTSGGKLYAYSFTSYVESNSFKAIPFNLKDQKEINNLESNCYQREKNAYIANLMLPIFLSYPELWKAVPILSSVQQVHHLSDALLEWREKSPIESQKGVDEIIKLF